MASPAPPATPSRWWVDALWLAALAGWSAWWCLSAGARLGLTFDERFYLNAGLDSWRKGHPGKLAVNGVMPLPIEAATLPVYLHERRAGVELDDGVVSDHVWRARPVTLGWLWLLIASAFRLGRAAGGPWAGRVAAGLVAADPTVLAHAALATTDTAVAATLAAFTRAVYAGRGGGWWRRVVLPGLWYGVAALCKLSALLYGGFILVALELAHRVAAGDLSRPPGGTAKQWARKAAFAAVRSAVAIGAVVAIGCALAGAYCGVSESGERPMALIAQAMPKDEPLRPLYHRVAAKVDRVPYAAAAFSFQWWHNARGRPSYLNGTYYPEGTRTFFPLVLAMKLPLPVILLGLLTLVRPRRCANPLALVAAVLLLVPTVNGNIQNGVRLVIPVMALGYVAVAVGVARGFGRGGAWAGAVAVAAMVATAAWVWPHGLSYLNRLGGGPEAAPYRVSDSNVDWGQWLPELVEWHRANGEPPTAVWYFGSDPAADRPPFTRFDGNSPLIRDAETFRALVGRRVLAVGTTAVTLVPENSPARIGVAYLKGRKPLFHTPRFALYDFRDPAGPPRE